MINIIFYWYHWLEQGIQNTRFRGRILTFRENKKEIGIKILNPGLVQTHISYMGRGAYRVLGLEILFTVLYDKPPPFF